MERNFIHCHRWPQIYIYAVVRRRALQHHFSNGAENRSELRLAAVAIRPEDMFGIYPHEVHSESGYVTEMAIAYRDSSEYRTRRERFWARPSTPQGNTRPLALGVLDVQTPRPWVRHSQQARHPGRAADPRRNDERHRQG
jgi:hypothetical protein